MPFLRLEISTAHAAHAQDLLDRAGSLITEIFALDTVRMKSAAFVTNDFQIGDKGQFDGFAHISVHCFRGRPRELCEKVTTELLSLLNETFAKRKQDISLAAVIVEIEPATTKVGKQLVRG